ncbi:class II aldolase/adducin family protein [Nocardioides bizhenqiangii]|uniref:Class II aldolase/adducin family protein n=1 Tax=Nocardioides bizhenqiangii TaxID=3095076 RepID=A0ABZ0ZLN9_9ACTN|nr:class II aldolase/adducin family protein [Nocardioides sp. HM61]WQQ25256.1 class II aldolase/adducin family protein [Nocardioides sp. HM61]
MVTDDAVQQVVRACHRLAAEGLLIGTAGNVSVRVGDRVAVTATGAVLGELTADQVVEVDLDGHQVGGGPVPTSEVYLHLSVYAQYDVAAVVHTHAPVSTAASIAVGEIPVIHYQQLLLGGAIRVAPYATFGTPELATRVVAALEHRTAALMANHGSIAIGATLDKAVENALLLEWLCTVYRDALAMGKPATLTRKQQEDVIAAAIARNYGSVQQAPQEENR